MVNKKLSRLKHNITCGLLGMSGRKKLIVPFAMIVVTTVWAVALCLHIQDYNRYIQEALEIMEVHGLDPGFFDPRPFSAWGAGPNLGKSGLIILGAWIVSYSLMRLRRRVE
ncbi:MAG: hypothetical protein JSV12_00885 [Candidatus Bathyarchaeota archaeon]|nr:MAG: hypothetical protein JSV12_00885 [Candidatus Bathyarchaeota archaeon]